MCVSRAKIDFSFSLTPFSLTPLAYFRSSTDFWEFPAHGKSRGGMGWEKLSVSFGGSVNICLSIGLIARSFSCHVRPNPFFAYYTAFPAPLLSKNGKRRKSIYEISSAAAPSREGRQRLFCLCVLDLLFFGK